MARIGSRATTAGMAAISVAVRMRTLIERQTSPNPFCFACESAGGEAATCERASNLELLRSGIERKGSTSMGMCVGVLLTFVEKVVRLA